ncbi:MAG: DUF4493 domain-containing protein [Bacteroidales bacterium]|nr:DUF4493 domain-containing protein [Bacteroidales bacterium]
MKKNILFSIFTLALLSACNVDVKPLSNEPGTLRLGESSLQYDTEVLTKASEASGNYIVTIIDNLGATVYESDYASIKNAGGEITLPSGNYILKAQSAAGEVPEAAFETPVYGASKAFSISSGETTELGPVVCTLLQTKVTVSYSEEFLEMVTGDGKANVSVASGLDFPLSYNSGSPSYDSRAGYFAVADDGSTTMVVTFRGSIDGKDQKMTKLFSGIQARSWHRVKFVKKVDQDGSADIIISIDDFVDDEELGNDVPGHETIIGEDPDAPSGDGGIKLESTCDYDITKPITVPQAPAPFILTMLATVPERVSTFTVDIKSTNEGFENAVKSVNDGSTLLDLVNPSEGTEQIFREILPFPYGDAVYNQKEIYFDLSDARDPLIPFTGTHTFTMKVTDKSGHSKEVSIVMVCE